MTNFYNPITNVDNFSLLFDESIRLANFVSFSDNDPGSQFYHMFAYATIQAVAVA